MKPSVTNSAPVGPTARPRGSLSSAVGSGGGQPVGEIRPVAPRPAHDDAEVARADRPCRSGPRPAPPRAAPTGRRCRPPAGRRRRRRPRPPGPTAAPPRPGRPGRPCRRPRCRPRCRGARPPSACPKSVTLRAGTTRTRQLAVSAMNTSPAPSTATAGRLVELAGRPGQPVAVEAGARRCPPPCTRRPRGPPRPHDLDPLRRRLGDVDVALRVDRHPGRVADGARTRRARAAGHDGGVPRPQVQPVAGPGRGRAPPAPGSDRCRRRRGHRPCRARSRRASRRAPGPSDGAHGGASRAAGAPAARRRRQHEPPRRSATSAATGPEEAAHGRTSCRLRARPARPARHSGRRTDPPRRTVPKEKEARRARTRRSPLGRERHVHRRRRGADQRLPGAPRRRRPLRRGPRDPPPPRLGLGHQGDHPALRRQRLQRHLPQPLRPPGARCGPRRRRGRHRGRPAASPTSSSWATPSAAIEALRALPTSNGKVGVIGYCSGGRHSFLTAVSLPVDAAVDCYGAFVTGTVPDGFPLKVTPLVDRTPDLRCPLLGLFGNEDQFPNREQVDELEAALEGGRQDVRVPPLRRRRPRVLLRRPPGLPARGGRRRLAAHLRVVRPLPGGGLTMCSYLTVPTDDRRQRQGRRRAGSRVTSAQRLLRPPVPRAVRPHAQHRLRRPVARPGRPRRRRAQRGVGPPAGREHRRGAGRRRGRRARDHTHRPGGRRPPALGPGAGGGAGVGGRGRRRAPPRPCATWPGGFSPGATAVLECARRRRLRQGGRRRAEPRFPGLPPPGGRGVRRAAAVAPRPAPPGVLRRRGLGGARLRGRSTGGRRATRGTRDELDRVADGAVVPAPTSSPRARCRRWTRWPTTPARIFGGWAELAATRRRHRRPRRRGRRATWTRLAELESGWPAACAGSTLLHGDVRADNVLVADERRRVRGLAPRRGRVPGLRPGRLGALGRARGRARRPKSCWRATCPPVPSTPTSSPSCWPPWPASSWRARSGRHRPGSPPCGPSRPPRVRWRWPGCGAAPAGDGPHGAGAPVGSAACASDCRSPTSPPASTPGALFDGVVAMATAAEETGFDSVWVMDHFYQLPPLGGPSRAHARLVHAARRAGGPDLEGAARAPW